LSEEIDRNLLAKAALGVDEGEQVSLIDVLENEVTGGC
jgi:hypothetical protein